MNIEDDEGNFIFRVAFRQELDQTETGPVVVLDSTEDKKWRKQVRATWPQFEEDADFTVLVECRKAKYVVYFNGELLGQYTISTYKDELPKAAAIHLWGGNAHDTDMDNPADSKPIYWHNVILPARPHLPLHKEDGELSETKEMEGTEVVLY